MRALNLIVDKYKMNRPDKETLTDTIYRLCKEINKVKRGQASLHIDDGILVSVWADKERTNLVQFQFAPLLFGPLKRNGREWLRLMRMKHELTNIFNTLKR